MVFSYAGSGRIPQFTAVQSLGLISYSYNSAVGEEFLYLDFGNVGLDYWVLEDHQNTVLSTIQNEQLINLTETSGTVATLDYGTITQVEAVSTEDWGLITVSSNITSYGFLHFQTLTTWSVVNTWVGTGTVWEMDSGTRYRLDAPWIGSGTLRYEGSANTNYVPAIAAEGLLPLRSDTKVAFSPNWNAFGTLFSGSFAGEAVTKVFPEGPRYSVVDIDSASDLYYNNPRPGSSLDPTLGTSLVSGGTGVGTSGGFNVGPHIRFGGSTGGTNGYRRVLIKKDLRNVDQLEIYAIKGNGSNGGEEPDFEEDLSISFASNFVDYFGDFFPLIPETNTNSDLQRIIVVVPEGAKREDQEVTFYQLKTSGTPYDHYGLVSVKYLTASEPTDGDTSKRLFSVHGSAGASFRPNWVGSGVLFSFSTTDITRTFDYVGSGTLFGLSSLDEAVTWDYNNSSIDYFTYEDFGSVAESPIDSITIQSVANQTIESLKDDRIVDLVNPGSSSGTFLDFGKILLDGSQSPSTVGLDWGEILTNQTDYPFGLFPIRGTADIRFTPNYVGSGGLFAFVEGIGRTKPRWIAYVNIDIHGAAVTNFSLLQIGSGSLFSFSNAQDRVLYNYSGSGDLYAFSGAADAVGFNPPEETFLLSFNGSAQVAFAPNWNAEGNLDISGEAVERNTESYYGSGVLFGFDNKVERRTYSYNSSSNVIFGHLDYGNVAESPIDSIVLQSIANDPLSVYASDRIVDLIIPGSTSGSFFDYGAIITDGEDQPETVTDDYEYITETISRYAFGDLQLTGTVTARREFNYVGSGDIKLWIDGIGRTKPRWIADVHLEVSGVSEFRASFTESGSGILYNFVSADKRRSFAYETTGTLYAISGTAEAVGFNPPDITTDIKIGSAAAVAYVPNWNGSGIVTVDVDHVVRSTYSEVGFGNLFNIGNKVERRTYSYNSVYPTSDVRFQNLNYGLVSDSVIDSIVLQDIANDSLSLYEDDKIVDLVYTSTGSTPVFDYGSVADPNPTVTDDYEFIWQTVGRFAMGDFKVTGVAKTNFSLTNEGSGQILVDVNTVVKVNPRWTADIFIDVTGDGVDAVSKSYKGSGIIPLPVSATDARTFSYEGRGELFAISGGQEAVAFDYPKPDHDIRVAGEAAVAYVPNWNGSGSIGTSGELVERVAYDIVGSGILYNFDNLVERRVYHYNTTSIDEYVHLDYGLVSTPAIDSVVIQTIANDPLTTYQSIKIVDLVTPGSGSGNYFDYGYLEQPLEAGLFGVQDAPDVTDDYQSIMDSATIYPFGRLQLGLSSVDTVTLFSLLHIGNPEGTQIKISGEVEVRLPNKHQGDGTLFAIEGAAESVTFSPDNLTGLFEFVGFAATRRIPNFNGGGTITLDGEAYSTVAFAGFQENTIALRGNATVKYTPSYTGSGAIFSAGILSESITKTFPLVPGYTADLTVTAADINSLVYKFGTLVTPAVEYTTSGTDAFNIGPHFRFGVSGTGASYSADGDRTVAFTLDLRNVEELTLNIVKGNGTNGGNAPECFNTVTGSGDNLVYQINGSNETLLVSACETSFETLNSVTIPVPVADRISNARIVIHQQQHSGSTLDAWGFQSVEYTINRAGDQRKDLFDIAGAGVERTTAVHTGSGSLFSLSGAVEAVAVAEDKRVLIDISGNAGERFIPNFNGSGSISVLSGAAESRTASPDDLTGLFEFVGFGKVRASVAESGLALIKLSGTTEPEILTFAEQPVGLVSLFGTARERYVPNWNGSGFISTLSGAAESFTVNPQEKDLLFSITGRAVESFSFGNYDGDANVRIFGQLAKTPNLTFAEQPVVQTSIFGEAEVINVDVYLAEGTIFGRGLVSESKTVKLPPIVPADIRLSGEATEAVSFNPPDITTEIKLSGEGVVPLRTFAEQPTIRVAISGIAIEKNTEAYLGTGVIFSNGLGGESVTRKLPEFTAHLNFNGVATESATFREIFFGSLFRFSGTTGPAIRSYAEKPQTLGRISGVADTTRARDFVGSGRIATLSGAAEAVSFNPLERQLLFSVDGRAATRYSRTWVGSGNVSIYPEASRIKFVPNWNVEGVIPVSGTAVERVARDEIVQVNIGTFSGAAEAVTFNPLERDMLFSFTGRASIRSAVSEVKQVELAVFAEPVTVHTVQVPPAGEGLVQTSGEGRIVITLSYIGDIRIGTFSGAAEAVTFNPLEKDLLFSATGFASLRSTRSYVGTGSLYAISGAAESRTVAPPASGLFTFAGDTRFSLTKPFIGSGNLFSVVSGEEKVAYDYVGEQVLFSLSGAARERITSSEVVFGSIFSFSGAAERVAYVPSLLADVNISGVALTPFTRSYVGSGDLPVFGGAAEARTITYENVAIFDFLGQVKPAITKAYVGETESKISGAAEESFIRAPYQGQIEVDLAGTASESATFNPPEEGTEITTSGEVKVLRSFGYEGSGTINVRGDAIIGIRIRIFGSGGARVFGQARVQALLQHQPDVHILLEGRASTARIQVSPPRTYGWII